MIDPAKIGMTGHSLGGKLTLLTAMQDPRIVATLLLDPVDGGGPTGCNLPQCVDVSNQMSGLHIPTGFLGETVDASGGLSPCAPAANNFTTFYGGANSPSFEATIAGANHMSFLDSTAGCLACGFCNGATKTNDEIAKITHPYVISFYERWLRGNAGYDTWLTGAEAQATWVATGLITLDTK